MDSIKDILQEKEFWLWVVTALSGWICSTVQFFVGRHNQKTEKLADRKYDTYSSYMKKVDEVMQGVQKSPSDLLNMFNRFFQKILNNSGNPDAINAELIKYNEEQINFLSHSIEPQMILKNESNNLFLICSDELKQLIDEMIKLTQDYNNAIQKTLGLISPNDSNAMVRNLQTLRQDERWLRFEKLKQEMIDVMRKEIGRDKNTKKKQFPYS